eukprot:CAMPEP_0206459758 /NCGR_PEP_ID=MMETSP0324_2-20121206/24360_1 /ASSEMBLY_ACC=CAM_ASM_000836 /TAXON_ID=2866 /ORGANISM="Crypthecodinium cohnii, Strain Seligo" /LENGTH=154 /DNA_ID=CAMNT_0053931357 /DNA_START=232 /DNA_END=697 /DNA_ORIENTATION=-
MLKASTTIASNAICRACQEGNISALRSLRTLMPRTVTSLKGVRGQQTSAVQLASVRGSMTGFGSGFADSLGPSATALPSNITLNGLVITDEIYIPVTQAGRLLLGKSEEVAPTSAGGAGTAASPGVDSSESSSSDWLSLLSTLVRRQARLELLG